MLFIVLGALLLILANYVEMTPPLDETCYVVGIILLIVGVVLLILHALGRPAGPRRFHNRYWW